MSLNKRVQTALLLLVPLAAILAIGGPLLVVLTFAVHLRINYEFFSLLPQRTSSRRFQLTLLSALLPLGYLAYGPPGFFAALLLAVTITFIFEILDIEREVHEEAHELLLGNAALGLCYTGVLGTSLVVIAATHHVSLLIWLLACVIAADTSAYYGGRAFGKNRLAPRLSPNKTCEGAVAGVLGAVLVSTAMSYVLHAPPVTMALWGVVVGVIAVLGDLIESMFKRFYGVKDTANLLPGHGGLLDRVDALIFAAPLIFFVAG